jgi:hypothetical protein
MQRLVFTLYLPWSGCQGSDLLGASGIGILMIVAAMDVRIMWTRVRVRERCMPVRMGMRLFAVQAEVVLMLMMAVVTLLMHVLHGRMHVFVVMGFGQVQPDTARPLVPQRPKTTALVRRLVGSTTWRRRQTALPRNTHPSGSVSETCERPHAVQSAVQS